MTTVTAMPHPGILTMSTVLGSNYVAAICFAEVRYWPCSCIDLYFYSTSAKACCHTGRPGRILYVNVYSVGLYITNMCLARNTISFFAIVARGPSSHMGGRQPVKLEQCFCTAHRAATIPPQVKQLPCWHDVCHQLSTWANLALIEVVDCAPLPPAPDSARDSLPYPRIKRPPIQGPKRAA